MRASDSAGPTQLAGASIADGQRHSLHLAHLHSLFNAGRIQGKRWRIDGQPSDVDGKPWNVQVIRADGDCG